MENLEYTGGDGRMKFDWLIVGAGFTGAVLAERIASQLDQRVILVDCRDHIGGNAYDYYDDHGILVHKYGAHIFHTNSERIWSYLSEFTSWRPYSHHVVGEIDGRRVPVPFNLNSLHSLFPRSMAGRLEHSLVEHYGFGTKVPILKMMEEQEPGLKELAQYIYRNVFHNYTVKQWGLKPEELDPSVTGRVPVFVSRDDRYFQDTYQGIPRHGYTELFRRLLAHPNIHVLLKTTHREAVDAIDYNRMIFTGPIDEYFSYCHGPLPYRSLRFDLRHERQTSFQDVAVVNFPNEHLFTRVIEFKHFSGQQAPGTTIAYEYPEPHEPGLNVPYYPVPKVEHREQYGKYLREAEALGDNVIFAGRLADYKYYNMDQAVGRALKVFGDITGSRERRVDANTISG